MRSAYFKFSRKDAFEFSSRSLFSRFEAALNSKSPHAGMAVLQGLASFFFFSFRVFMRRPLAVGIGCGEQRRRSLIAHGISGTDHLCSPVSCDEEAHGHPGVL